MYEFNVEGNGSIKSVQAGTFTWHLVIKIMCESLILSGYVGFDQRLSTANTYTYNDKVFKFWVIQTWRSPDVKSYSISSSKIL